MQLEEIIKIISDGLSGSTQEDLDYLALQLQLYQNHPLSNDIRIRVYQIIDEYIFDDDAEALQAYYNGITESLQEFLSDTQAKILAKQFEESLAEIDSKIEELNAEVMYVDTDKHTFKCFELQIEEHLCNLHFPTGKEWREMPLLIDKLYLLRGVCLHDLKRYVESIDALKIALKYNPICMLTLFELSENYKRLNKWDEFNELMHFCVKIVYTPQALARSYRNIAFYYIEMAEYEVAADFLFASLAYHQTESAENELAYIKTKDESVVFDKARVKQSFDKYGIVFGFDNTVFELCFNIAKSMHKQHKYRPAKFYYQLCYDIYKNDKLLSTIEELTKVIESEE